MKKYTMILVLCLIFVLSITGCKNAENEELQNTEENGNVTEKVVNDDTTVIETEFPEEPAPDIVALTEEELEWFETEFFNTEENRIINMFMTSEYFYAKDIDLRQLFYGGTYAIDASPVSEEEEQLLKERYDIMELDICKVTTDEMDAILQKYLGMTLEETNKIGIDGLYYLEEYDAYYSVAGDTEYMRYDMDYGWKNVNGTITIEYTHDQTLSSDKELYSVTLKEVDGNYYFVSNESVK